MSRWFRHYAGMMRDDKLVRVAIRSKQSIERVVWVWGAILESAAEIDDAGRYDFDAAEAAYFLRADQDELLAIEDALASAGRVAESRVVKWGDRQFQSDRSAERQRRYRERKRDGDTDGEHEQRERQRDERVTSPSRHRDAPYTETETETECSEAKASGDVAPPNPEKVMFDAGVKLLTASGKSDTASRALLGKWRKNQGSAAVIEALGAAQREGAIDPAAYIEGRWRAKGAQPQPAVPL